MSENLHKPSSSAGSSRSPIYEETPEYARTELARMLTRATLLEKRVLWCFRFKTDEEARSALRLSRPIEHHARLTLRALGHDHTAQLPITRLKDLVGIAFKAYRDNGGSLHGLNVGYHEPSSPAGRWTQGRGASREAYKNPDPGSNDHGKYHVEHRTPIYLSAVEHVRTCTDARSLRYLFQLSEGQTRKEMADANKTNSSAVGNELVTVLRDLPSFDYPDKRTPEYRRQLNYFIAAALQEAGCVCPELPEGDPVSETAEAEPEEVVSIDLGDPEADMERTVSAIKALDSHLVLFEVLRAVGAGKRNAEIGDELDRDPSTISAMVSLLFEKLHAPKFVGGSKTEQVARRRAYLIAAWNRAYGSAEC